MDSDEKRLKRILPLKLDSTSLDMESLTEMLVEQTGNEGEARRLAAIIMNDDGPTLGHLSSVQKFHLETNDILTRSDIDYDEVRVALDPAADRDIDEGTTAEIAHGARSATVRVHVSAELKLGEILMSGQMYDELGMAKGDSVTLDFEKRTQHKPAVSVDFISRSEVGPSRQSSAPRKIALPAKEANALFRRGGAIEQDTRESREKPIDNDKPPYEVEDGFRFWRRRRPKD